MENVTRKTWLRRNLTWLFPLLLIVITGIYLIFTGEAGFGNFARAYTDKPLFDDAVKTARQDERVVEALGTLNPIDKMTIAEGAVEYTEDGNGITATITVKGEKGNGKLDIVARKEGKAWHYDLLKVRVKDTKEEIIILPED